MRKLLVPSFFIIALPVILAAQDTQQKVCPTVSITGPAGVSMPYDAMTFRAIVTGDVPKQIGFRWEVTEGAIMGGEGTSELKARYTSVDGFKASVTVIGLPNGCPANAAERLSMSVDPGPEYLGAINNPKYAIEAPLFERLRDSMNTSPNSQLYVWVYPECGFGKLKAHLLNQLSATKIDPSRITLRGSSDKARGAISWRIPPGSENPSP